MTDRVIEIRLIAPRPNLLAAARPARIRRSSATASAPGPFQLRSDRAGPGAAAPHPRRSMRQTTRQTAREEVLLARRGRAAGGREPSPPARPTSCSAARSPICRMRAAVKLPRGALRFDPASGLFGLVPVRKGGAARRRRCPPPAQPGDRPRRADRRARRSRPGRARDRARAGARRRFRARPPAVDSDTDRGPPGHASAPRPRGCSAMPSRPSVCRLPEGPGIGILFSRLATRLGRDRADCRARAVGCARPISCSSTRSRPSSSPAWFVRQFRCERRARLRRRDRRAARCRARHAGCRPSATPCWRRRRRGSTTRSCSSRSPRRCAGRWSPAASTASPGTATPATR